MKARATLVLVLAIAGACQSQEHATDSLLQATTSSVAIDQRPTSMADLLRRFQAETRSRPARLANSAKSREELVTRFLEALESRDTVALERLRVTPSEFSYLYFPESIFMRPPYELDPRVVWMQVDAGSNAGLQRALRRYGGRPLGFVSLVCQTPQRQGSMQLHGCDVRRVDALGDTISTRMFGAILERAGEFKFLSLENKL